MWKGTRTVSARWAVEVELVMEELRLFGERGRDVVWIAVGVGVGAAAAGDMCGL